jgi:hypothetical protein
MKSLTPWMTTFGFALAATMAVGHAQAPLGATVTLGVGGGRTYSLVTTAPAEATTPGYFTIFDNTAGQFRLVINPSGNVAIGTTTATRAKLFVVDTTVGTAVGGSTVTTGSGVYGENTSGTGGGYGVYGTNATGWGVYGISNGFLYAGVAAFHSGTPGYALYGKATGPGSVGLHAESDEGFAIAAYGNVYQQRDKGGFVKAMIKVNENATIERCYNGLTGSASNGCGFTVVLDSLGSYLVDFGFDVTDRFISVTSIESYTPDHAHPIAISAGEGANGVIVRGQYPDNGEYTNLPFYIFVF